MAIKSTQILQGTSGKVWLNGKELANLESIEIKITGNYDEHYVLGKLSSLNVFTGWSGSGSITLKKIDSEFLKILGDAYKTGAMPDVKIITALTPFAGGKTERVAISDIVITEFNLSSFESNGVITEELPFKFSEYEILETI